MIASSSPTSARTASSAGRLPCTSYSAAALETLWLRATWVGSVDDLETDAALLSGGARAHDCTQSARDPSLPADHLAAIGLRDEETEHELVVLVELLDPDGVGLVHELAREIFEQLGHDLRDVLRLQQLLHGTGGLHALAEPVLHLLLVVLDRRRIR